MVKETYTSEKISCYHCGDECQDKHIHREEKVFCCEGCKMVYEILNENSMCEYYDLEKNPGITQKVKVREGKFAILDDENVQGKLIHFNEGTNSHTQFYLPQMHCASCVWLLENLNKLDKGVIKSQVNFLKKNITVIFDNTKTSLRKIAEVLTRIGYEPHISLQDVSKKKITTYNRSEIIKIGVAGFCFGNIMLLSFPEYFSIKNSPDLNINALFSWLNLLLALPVFFYCATGFFTSAYHGIKQKFLNIDAPIALAVLITFMRSIYEITTQSGAGYLDSMSGIVFFMLVGRYFQNKTYDSISFERDFTAYFPLGVTTLDKEGNEKQVSVAELKIGDRIKIHNEEIIPADSILFMGKAIIDYSFVTGESATVDKTIGEIVYAGGKQKGAAIEMEVVKEVSKSYLTQLWNSEVFNEQSTKKTTSFVHKLSRYFTYMLFSIATLSAIYWYFNDASKILDAITSVLIVACPCALLLSATFTNGNMLSLLSKKGFYLKNSDVLERMKGINTIVFDKTGTITQGSLSAIEYYGDALTEEQQLLTGSLLRQSSHPLSKAISATLPNNKRVSIKNFWEEKGKGISAIVDQVDVKIGSKEFVGEKNSSNENYSGSKIYVRIADRTPGYFLVKGKYREGLEAVIAKLRATNKLVVLSGDNDSEKDQLKKIFGEGTEMFFNKKPEDKLEYIKQLQGEGKKVMMVGDGLNDAGALAQANVGIAVSDNTNNFSPACDAILSGTQFNYFFELIKFTRKQKTIIVGSFIISIVYNIVGLFYAVSADLEPVIAAILMPASTFSIVLFTVGMSSFFARKVPTDIYHIKS
ncbi:MAG: heavy metal translocating P-type ATPase metal-binding domain-containing protein [Bacteroidota bacterium]|nr:heavy metal translocating P-type ATPase metal-binding domain-containing protein [Bacteroidota bacterium]